MYPDQLKKVSVDMHLKVKRVCGLMGKDVLIGRILSIVELLAALY